MLPETQDQNTRKVPVVSSSISGRAHPPGSLGAFLFSSAIVCCGFAHAHDPVPAGAPRILVVHLLDHAPASAEGLRRGSDGSWTLSTGGAGGGANAPRDNGSTLSTSSGERVLRVREGERFLLELPSVQSLQFRVPVTTAAKAGSAAGSSATGAAGSQAAPPGPTAEGVVYFDAVASFAARLRLQGSHARLELQPVLAGTVRAPFDAPAPPPVPVELELGRWQGLGGGEGTPGRLSAAPATEDALWIRVEPEASGPAQ